MEWASDVFPIENREDRSGFAKRVWRTPSVDLPSFISVALPTWQLVFVRSADGATSVIARGPETEATRSGIPVDAEIFGIQFDLGVFLSNVPIATLVDHAELLTAESPRSFWLNGSRFETPTFENADVFVEHLARSGGLLRDPVVTKILQRRPVSLSDRSIQRRFIRSTGITYSALRQIERAERAGSLLRSGVSVLDVIEDQGYSDQAHLTRSVKRYLGITPGCIVKAGR